MKPLLLITALLLFTACTDTNITEPVETKLYDTAILTADFPIVKSKVLLYLVKYELIIYIKNNTIETYHYQFYGDNNTIVYNDYLKECGITGQIAVVKLYNRY